MYRCVVAASVALQCCRGFWILSAFCQNVPVDAYYAYKSLRSVVEFFFGQLAFQLSLVGASVIQPTLGTITPISFLREKKTVISLRWFSS